MKLICRVISLHSNGKYCEELFYYTDSSVFNIQHWYNIDYLYNTYTYEFEDNLNIIAEECERISKCNRIIWSEIYLYDN